MEALQCCSVSFSLLEVSLFQIYFRLHQIAFSGYWAELRAPASWRSSEIFSDTASSGIASAQRGRLSTLRYPQGLPLLHERGLAALLLAAEPRPGVVQLPSGPGVLLATAGAQVGPYGPPRSFSCFFPGWAGLSRGLVLLLPIRFDVRIKGQTFQLQFLASKNMIVTEWERHNGPASAAPCQEGHFWKRSETKKRILRVAQKTQIRAALQELLESLPDRMWRETMRSKCAKTVDSEKPVSEYVCL